MPLRHVNGATNKLVPVCPAQANSSNFGSPNGSIPDLDGMGARPSSTMEEQIKELPNFDSHVQTISNAVGLLQSCLQVLSNTSMPSLPTCSHSRQELLPPQACQDLGSRQVGDSIATGSRDTGSTDENRSTRRKLETSPDDENLRSAVLSQFPCEQCRAGVSAWTRPKTCASNLWHSMAIKWPSTFS